ncbi:hypothetical protein M758_8G160300 [Ceratodon purpureus]|nr:hypothetical protein M758_8G160300 [Ceratodon purpureus]
MLSMVEITEIDDSMGKGREGRMVRFVRNGCKRERSVESSSLDSGSETDDAVPVPPRSKRRANCPTDSQESEDATAAPPPRRSPRVFRTRREHQEYSEDDEEAAPPPRRSPRVFRTRREREEYSEDDDEGPARRTRINAKVVEAVWTPEKTVRITYDIGVKHACMNPAHGKGTKLYTVLHLTRCTWKHNVSLMKPIPSITKPKLYQYCHKLCQSCLDKYGPQCFKCYPSDGDIVPKLDTVFAEVVITCVEDFTDAVREWQIRRDDVEASYLVLHCTVLGPEASLLRRKLDLKRSTTVHIVYSDVRDRMEPAGSGQNLEDTMFKNVWKIMMTEKVHSQDRPLVSFYGNILLNEGVTFNDFRVNDLLLMYQPNILTPLEQEAMRASINTLSLQLPFLRPFVEVAPSDCCLHDAVVHTHREPRTVEDDAVFQHGNLVAGLFYESAKRQFGDKIFAEFLQRAVLGERLKIGEEGQKLPFGKLFAARGGDVQFRRVATATQDVARRERDMRTRVCSVDTSGFELVCWTSRGAPSGGDFVIPGLMYKFETNSGSALIFRPRRYFHATLPASNRDLKNEKFAASFVTGS